MAKKTGVFGNNHETFLFNPPFVSLPISKIQSKVVRNVAGMANSLITAALAKVVQHFDDDDEEEEEEEEEEEGFANNLASWVPHLFLNRADPVCSEYISYFERRIAMKKIGAAKIEEVASQHSKRDLIFKCLGRDSDPFHLLPSAKLIINESESRGFLRDHELEQWQLTDLKLKCKEFLWKDLSSQGSCN